MDHQPLRRSTLPRGLDAGDSGWLSAEVDSLMSSLADRLAACCHVYSCKCRPAPFGAFADPECVALEAEVRELERINSDNRDAAMAWEDRAAALEKVLDEYTPTLGWEAKRVAVLMEMRVDKATGQDCTTINGKRASMLSVK